MSAPSQRQLDGSSLEVRTLALQLLGDTGAGPVSVERVEEVVGIAIEMVGRVGRPADVDRARLARDIESMVNVFVGEGTSLDDERDHRPWLGTRRDEIDWRFWERYRRYLAELEGLPPAAVRRLDDISDDVLGKLEDPEREGPWDRRGMVVGQVQSGKTANYTGLICKAADAGYKLIVVLAGVHNSLRSQTQLRLDQGFLGFDTQKERLSKEASRRIGVGRLPGYKRLFAVNSLTNSEERGDFNLKVARQVAMYIGSDPILLVIKKNASILRNLKKWATELNQHEHPETGRMVVPGIPLLVIDDEADHASVNTKDVPLDESGHPDEDADPTRINALIRDLLYSFEQTAYVGYTATPFANIFAYTGEPSERYGDDVFPRSFIRRLPAPSNHVGPAEVFGIQADAAAGLEGREPLDIVRDVSDAEEWIPTRHRKDWQPGALPDSLREALMSFVLTCAARAARGQTDTHNSMLVHVTRFVAVQELVAEQIYDELGRIQDRLRYGDGGAPRPLVDSLRALWERDFVPTSSSFDGSEFPRLTWDQVEPRLATAASRIEPLTINGSAKDALTYYDHPDGISVVAVGGDKLSRGLTLEGLSISYFLRASRMYDTLMQMGRWFGYRPGYLDLCRLYLPGELREWYRDITAANEELLLLFDEMAAVGGTPEHFGLRVRKSPDGLLITARAKMRNGKEMKLSFDNSIVETIAFHRDRDVQARNLNLTERFLERQTSSVGEPSSGERGGTLIWKGVDGADVADLLFDFTTHEGARKADGALLAKYIRSCVENQELTDWTVALISVTGGSEKTIAGRRVGLITRTVFEDGPTSTDAYRIRRIGSPQDEAIDLDEEAAGRALEKTRRMWQSNPPGRRRGEEPKFANGPAIRSERPRERGLLLLYPLDPAGAYGEADPARFEADFPTIMGFAVSFPESDTAPTVDYVVNNNFWQMEMGLT